MQKFMGKDFLLTTKTARRLYHEVASLEPIFDYHCHLSPREIAENRRFSNLAELWLGGDHYKWRQMRTNGIPERLITGDADPWEKFEAWAATMPLLVGNPLYHWSHLELQRYFGIREPLNPSSALRIWEASCDRLDAADFDVNGIFERCGVYAVGTTDDPVDSLEWHAKVKADGKTATKVLPSFRPDKALLIEKPEFPAYIEKLGAAAGMRIANLDDLLAALAARVAFFDENGCRASDHGLEYAPFTLASDDSSGSVWEREVRAILERALAGAGAISGRDADSFKTYVLAFLGGEYAKRGWAMQLHMSAIRANNVSAVAAIGPDSGFDASHDIELASRLSGLLNLMESRGALPKTILYSLNPKDYYSLGTLMGCFQGGVPGKIQLGSAWWFCDHRDGMEEQLKVLGNLGMLSRFVGMLTDSRSFLSYPRHEYFRRILCALLGQWVENGEIPADRELLDRIVSDISFANAKRYFEE